MAGDGGFVRLAGGGRRRLAFFVDGEEVPALDGDTVLTALLAAGRGLGPAPDSRRPRGGFCLIGACQDCWVRAEDGRPLRACTTPVADGMRLRTPAAGDGG